MNCLAKSMLHLWPVSCWLHVLGAMWSVGLADSLLVGMAGSSGSSMNLAQHWTPVVTGQLAHLSYRLFVGPKKDCVCSDAGVVSVGLAEGRVGSSFFSRIFFFCQWNFCGVPLPTQGVAVLLMMGVTLSLENCRDYIDLGCPNVVLGVDQQEQSWILIGLPVVHEQRVPLGVSVVASLPHSSDRLQNCFSIFHILTHLSFA